MKIKSLSTTSFGKFKTKSWEELSPAINVFYGENEAGKSTVFKMLIQLMFGFNSKNIAKNSLVNQATQQLNVSGEIVVNDSTLHLERDLNSGGQLKVHEHHKEYVYENVPVEAARHINKETYEEIYALELNRLSKFSDASWQNVEELLMQQFSGDTFKSTKQVLDSIEEKMKKIKRQSERGNSQLKSLEEERRVVFKKKKGVQANLEKVEMLNEKLVLLDAQIEDVKIKKMNWHHQLSVLEVYLPLMLLVDEKREIDTAIETFKNFEGLDEHQYLEKKKQIKRLYLKMDEVSEKVSKFVYEKRKLLERLQDEVLPEVEFNEIYQKYLLLDESDEHIETLKQKLIIGEHGFKKEFENTFDEKFKHEHFKEILDINYLNLKSLIHEIETLYEEIKILKRNKRTGNASNPNSKIFFMIVIAVASGVLYYLDLGKLYNSGSMLMIGIAVVMTINLFIKKQYKVLDEDELFEERDTLRSRLVKELNGIKLSSIAEEYIGHEFLTQILGLKNLAEQYRKDNTEYELKSAHNFKLNDTVLTYIKKHYGEVSKGDQPFDSLLIRLEDNKKHQSRIAVINGQLDVLNDQLQDIEKQLNENEAWVLEAEGFLKTYGDGELSIGLEKLKSKDLWLLRRTELEKKISSVDFSETTLKKFVLAYNDRRDDREFDKTYIQTELDIINKSLNDKIIEYAAIEKDVSVLVEQSDLKSVLGELESIDESIKSVKLKYDQLLLMHHVIKTAEEKYRTENQPEVFKHAGGYLDMITDGIYNALEVVELTENKKSKYEIHVVKDNQKIKVDETFSMGTLNQIYLSLRMSLIDHLDDGHTLMPICFDELLVNWDKKRLDKTLKIIEIISKKRQVMIFTCHEWFLNSLISLDDVKVFNL